MLENIDKNLKKIIADCHIDGYGQDLEYWIQQIGTKTSNYKNMLPRDLTNDLLIKHCDENMVYDVVRRGFYELLLLFDKKSNILFTCMSEECLNRILKDKKREIPHYIDILSLKNERLESKTHQLSIEGINNQKFDRTDLDRKLVELCSNLEAKTLNLDYRHAIVTFEKTGYNITSLRACVFNAQLELVENEDWSQYLQPGYEVLNAKSENQIFDKPIKPRLKSEFIKKVEDISPEIKKNDSDENNIQKDN